MENSSYKSEIYFEIGIYIYIYPLYLEENIDKIVAEKDSSNVLGKVKVENSSLKSK